MDRSGLFDFVTNYKLGWDGSSQMMVGRHQFSKFIDDRMEVGATRIFTFNAIIDVAVISDWVQG